MSNDVKEEELELDQNSDTKSDESLETDSYEELLEKNDNLEKQLLRATADLDNSIKRTASEVEKAHKYGVEKLLSELLPVIDNIEHALDKLSEDASSEDREGIELTDEANVKIHNKHQAVTNLIENVYIPNQSEACLDLHRLVGQKDKQGPVFPGTTIPVKHFKDEYNMARTWTVRTTAQGWPKELDFWKFNQVVQGVFQVSHRYNSRTHKFSTPNGIALVRDVIQQAGYQPHNPLIKSPKDTIAGVWKDWFLETKPMDLKKSIRFLSGNIGGSKGCWIETKIIRRDCQKLFKERILTTT